ncbi:uncharacterized protein LOC115324209 [Ixodes scapularis]|uniref:uncharacterized protein LOC115324209 n=1 Tax=Ixodes scapularis TaxID=6945 RepID=UPI001AD74476|nr:uncharacterized protein LOC115324209 [Ixodes scapularis]
MRLQPGSKSAVKAARRIPVALQERVKAELDRMEAHQVWVWTERQQSSFKTLRKSLIKAPVLAYFEQGKPVTLSVDTSQTGVGAVIIQSGHPIAYSSRSLTDTQQKYAQIEKEALAIVHGCSKVKDYILGHSSVTVESDHKPQEAIFRKPLCDRPLRLQRMRLMHQRYPITVQYKPGKELFLADALSRFPTKTMLKDESDQFQVNIVSTLSVSDARLHDILQATENDAAFVQLREYASASWPAEKRDVPEELQTYWNYRDEMHVEDGLVCKSNKVIKELRQSTASSVVSACAEVFATHGIPAKLCSDNGPPFNSYNFKDFVSKFRIIHVTSSPHHPRSNGMAERAVQEAKKLLTRCSYNTLDFCSALLEWRNSPRDNLLKSPVQRLMGRQTRTLLPVPDCCLEPAIVPPKEVHKRLQEIRSKQRTFYNRTKALPELQDGQQVSAFDTISHTWSPAVVMRRAGPPRSFVIETGDGRVLRRTREHLRVLPPRQQQLVTTAAAESTRRQVREEPSTGAPPSQDPPTQELRRSSRQRRSPVRYPRPEL